MTRIEKCVYNMQIFLVGILPHQALSSTSHIAQHLLHLHSLLLTPHSSLFTTSHPTNESLFFATFLAKMGSKPTQYDIGTNLDAWFPRSGVGLGQKGRIDKKSSSFRQQPNSSRII
jgi:hypothetical protein